MSSKTVHSCAWRGLAASNEIAAGRAARTPLAPESFESFFHVRRIPDLARLTVIDDLNACADLSLHDLLHTLFDESRQPALIVLPVSAAIAVFQRGHKTR